jgi:hypothetical protein
MRQPFGFFVVVIFAAGVCACSGDDNGASSNTPTEDVSTVEDTGAADVAADSASDPDTDPDATGAQDTAPDAPPGSDASDTPDADDAGEPPTGPFDYDESAYDDYIDTAPHYRFPLDSEGWAEIEPGQQHQILYVANDGDDGNSGLSEAEPLATLGEARDRLRQDSSDWVLLRRGDTFPSERFREELSGESPEHPMVIGAYGDGPRPVIEGALMLWATHRNVVIRDIKLEKVGKFCLDVLGTVENLYVENVVTQGCESRIQGSDDPQHRGVTLRRSMLLDGHFDEPHDGASDWTDAHGNRLSGIYVANVDGLLIEECYADKNGWEDGFDADAGPGPHPPSMFSHNFYIQGSNDNVILRGTISSRGASFGAQVRPGGIVQQNLFFGNNAAFFTATRASLVEDNVVTIAGNKVAHQIGALGWGIGASDMAGSVHRRNVVAHSVDPLASAPEDHANNAIADTDGVTLEDNVVYNWGSSTDQPDDLGGHIDPDTVSLLHYVSSSPIGAADMDALHDALRERDRDNWPAYLSAPAIVDYFSQEFLGEP